MNKRPRKTILFLDLDGTLIHPLEPGRDFPQGVWDMRFDMQVLKAIKNMQPEYVCIVSNQGGIASGYVNEDDFRAKLRYIQHCIIDYCEGKCKVTAAYCASNDADNAFRKPNTGMYDECIDTILANEDHGVCLEKSVCLMVGDASGKPDQFSDSDKKFAENCGIDYADVFDFKCVYAV